MYRRVQYNELRSRIAEPRDKIQVLSGPRQVGKSTLVKQVLELGCAYSGKELSLNKMVGQLQDAGNVTTLDESRLLCGLHKYASDNARKYNSVPKLMVYNTALFSVQSGMSYNKAFTAPKIWGRWMESAVGAYLLNNAEEYDYKLYYWREREDEVDFIIDSDNKLIALEVKSGRRTDNEGLSEFIKRFNPDYSLVVGSGGVPLEEFLRWDLGKLIDR